MSKLSGSFLFSFFLILTAHAIFFSKTELAAQTEAPYPPSSVITDITFASPSTIIRKARGSDNWPVTWGDDNNLYTAYGDGWGFQDVGSGPKVRLGVSRVSGSPTSFNGEDLAELDHWGDGGGGGIKATGILMVDGKLYLWSRRNGGRLWKSTNHGASWQETGIAMEQPDRSFSALHFLQFGKNYQGARDRYVYIYGSGGGYIFLFRAPKDAIDKRSSYEFYAGLDVGGNLIWSSDINQRVPIVSDPKGAYGPRIVYNPGIRRYLLTYYWLDAPRGPLVILDAPEPWGPWTTVFYTENWDQGFTFEYSFPQKWMSPNGKTMYMVFAGTGQNDAFAVRKVTLTLASASHKDLIGHWRFDEGGGTTVADSSRNGNHGTLVNGPTWTTGKIGGALDFDGVNDRVDLNAVNFDIDTSRGTFSLWIKRRWSNGYTEWPVPFVIADWPGKPSKVIRFYWDAKRKYWVFNHNNGHRLTLAADKIPQNEFTHVAVTWDEEADEFKVYIDGTLAANNTGLRSWAGTVQRTEIVDFRHPRVDAIIGEVRIYNGPLSSEEILALYNANPGTPPPLAPTDLLIH